MALKIRVLSVGKSHEPLLVAAISTYEQRLRPIKLDWVLLPPKSEATIAETIASESHSILQSLKPAEYVYLLDERGMSQTSEQFSQTLYDILSSYKDVGFVIGGAYGVSDAVRSRANGVLSLSKMVFPHQLVRLLLVEQLYRAASIHGGTKYHHGS